MTKTDEIAKIILRAIQNKRDSDTYGVSYALKMNAEVAEKAAEQVSELILDAAQQTWQPIETAPKDGTEIIGVFHRRYDEDGPATVYGPWTLAWDGRKWRSSWDGSEVISSESDFGTEYKGPDIDPTHWQPLPDVSIPSTEGK